MTLRTPASTYSPAALKPFSRNIVSPLLTSRRQSSRSTAVLSAIVFFALTACNKTVDDATLTANIKAALAADSTIAQQPVQLAVLAGVATLTGNVSDETASSVAAQDAAKVAGVKEIVNNLSVAGIAVQPTITVPAAPTAPRPTTPEERTVIARHEALPPPPVDAPPPPQPTFHDVSVPANTEIPIRITESLNSDTTQTGTTIHGVVSREVVSDGYVVIPAGSSVSGSVIDAKDAGHFKGNSILSIQFTSLRRHGNLIAISTDPYTVEGKGRGKNTAEKVGGGAAIGAVLGGIFGGGKGAAIGAAAGAGGGTVLQGATRGQQVQIPSESVIRFRLASPFTVRTSESPDMAPASSGLQTR